MDLTNPSNATISDAQGVGTIQNDDAAPPSGGDGGGCNATGGGAGPLALLLPLGVLVFLKRRRGTAQT